VSNINYRRYPGKKNHHVAADGKLLWTHFTKLISTLHPTGTNMCNLLKMIPRLKFIMKFSDMFDRGKLLQAKLIIKYNVIFSHVAFSLLVPRYDINLNNKICPWNRKKVWMILSSTKNVGLPQCKKLWYFSLFH